ncbi:MAG: putative selenate reductase subunit YgfK [Synergistaceae bacterium]|jgi:putative selenate reductase|nr:putative selenate reductase subunit YgfK [Synergistaceae bacterium]
MGEILIMKPQTLSKLVTWIKREYSERGSIFGIEASKFLNHPGGAPYSSTLFGEFLAAPVGPAAGPGTQLTQNIVSAWLSGARFIELKTVQIMDELEIARPCIDMEDEGYNVEWSQELKLEESAREYAKAWVLIPVIRRLLGWEGAEDGTLFNVSVGYNLKGILEPRMRKFLDTMTGAGELIAECMDEIAKDHPEFADVKVASRMSGSCTLSTMHGCPPDEVGKIAAYLLGERGFNLSIKLNPTLMGPDFVRGALRDALGYTNIEIPDPVFEHDLKFPQAVEIIKSMKELSARKGLYFGVKLSNTLAMRNTKGFMPGEEMYMSGRALYPITMNLWNRLSVEFGGDIDVSYSAGANAWNTPLLLRCGAKSVTVASDILKPGGYSRFPQYIRNIADEMRGRGASNLNEFAARKADVLAEAAASAIGEKEYAKKYFRGVPKVKSPLNKFDCIEAPCRERCPVCQDIPSYTLAISRGDFDLALDIILARNPLPGVTGHVCTHACESGCSRANYDEPVGIRALKRFAAERGRSAAPKAGGKTGRRVAVIGAGPSGLAAAALMARRGLSVTVYEARERAGGMMAIAPEFRLPHAVMDRDVQRIVSLGVDIEYGAKIAGSPEKLLKDGFDAVYLSCGFPKDAPLGIEGDDAPGVWGALDLLERVARGERPKLGRVLVVGGGNTAVDAARTAQRLSGEPVVMVYRRTRAEMPAERDEQELLFEEGNSLVELALPKRVVTADGKVSGLECEKARLGEPDASGRRRPEPSGEFFTLEADSIVAAIGQSADEEIFNGTGSGIGTGSGKKLGRGKNSSVVVSANGRTDVAGVYAGGDAVTGPATVISACAEGAKAAEAICSELGAPAEKAEKILTIPPAGGEFSIVRQSRSLRVAPETEERGALESRGGFGLVEKTLDEAAAVREAKRCLQCQTVCRKCVEVCPNRANFSFDLSPISVTLPVLSVAGGVPRSTGQETFSIGQGEQILHIEDFCNECGNCGVFCVHQGLPYRDKPKFCLDEAYFAASKGKELFKAEPGRMRRRVEEREDSLSFFSRGYRYETKGLSVEMDRGFRVTAANLDGAGASEGLPAGSEVSLRGAMEMWAVYSGITNSLPWLLDLGGK